jgi:putative endonuclease
VTFSLHFDGVAELSRIRREIVASVTPLLHGGAYVAAMSTDLRRHRGNLGERLAAQHLIRRGYAIVDRNYRTRHGELDIVAANARTLVFCEVKTRVVGGRTGPATPLEAIGPDKQRRLRALAREWLATDEERPHRPEIRFDAIGITISPSGNLLALEHLEAAF